MTSRSEDAQGVTIPEKAPAGTGEIDPNDQSTWGPHGDTLRLNALPWYWRPTRLWAENLANMLNRQHSAWWGGFGVEKDDANGGYLVMWEGPTLPRPGDY